MNRMDALGGLEFNDHRLAHDVLEAKRGLLTTSVAHHGEMNLVLKLQSEDCRDAEQPACP
jgi:hypothetical protein